MDQVNVVIVGGGVVGCAIAAAVAACHADVFVVEQMPRPGMATSTHNSGVIHSGLYYQAGSLKARHCVRGNRMLYEFCAAHAVPHRNTGKVLVASTVDEVYKLEALLAAGTGNGVEGIRIVDRAALRRREPHVEGAAALEIPSSGIVSAEELVKTFARLATERGAAVLTHTRVTALEPVAGAIRVRLKTEGAEGGATEEVVETRCLVNSAGLFADDVAALLGNSSWRIYPVRGEYSEVIRSRAHLINALVYPLPHPEGLSLGVHFTRTLWGTVLVGPTARYISDKNDYERDRDPVERFAEGARTLLPELTADDLALAYSGIRPKLSPPGGGPADFVITRDASHTRAIHLVGIESPGLTAAPSIAEEVAAMVGETLG